MPEWIQVAAPVAIIVVLTAFLLLVFLWRCCSSPKPQQHPQQLIQTSPNDHHHRTLQDGIAKLHQTSLRHQLHRDNQRRPGYNVFRRGSQTSRPLFNWADHPSLVTDAVENGWSRFAFTAYMQSPSTRSPFLGLCTNGDYNGGSEPVLTWEVCQGSVDFMQRIRLNPEWEKQATPITNNTAASAIRTALPLPGPPLGDSPFPQEAYFEITILHSGDGNHVSVPKVREGERTKLIQENCSSGSLVHTGPYSGPHMVEESKFTSRDEEVKGESVALSVGLTAGGSLPLKLPGSYPGSIGFNSTGSVYLDGIKLVFETESTNPEIPNKVIGCGFNPKDKKVFFTLDSELKHVIQCKSESFGSPLYPTLAANSDITVLVNFGQTPFVYSSANANRTSNPCFIGPTVRSPAALGYEDSRELFSMGRIDAHWLNGFMNRGSIHNSVSHGVKDFDEESDADLFEIVLDSSGRSPAVGGVRAASNSTSRDQQCRSTK